MGADYNKVAVSKYKSVSQRSFKTRLELFLFDLIIKEQISYPVKESDFIQFQVSDWLVLVYEQSWQTDEIVINNKIQITSGIDKKYKEWGNSNEVTKKSLFKAYESHFEKTVLSFDQFKEVFPEDPKMRICHYTNLSDFDFQELRRKQGLKTKNARGRYMEIDRLNSNKEYFYDNIVLCCYWANNAKTDEFTYPEFKNLVGPAMEKVFRERLQNK